jgi:hypothetical protein
MKNSSANDYTSLIAIEAMIESSMRAIRDKRVMLCNDVAKMYHVSPDHLLKQVKKNIDRFPAEYFFKLKPKEKVLFQAGEFPYAFTEHAILMLGGVLKNKEAIKVNVQFIRYFMQLFEKVSNDKFLSQDFARLTEGEAIFDVLKQMVKKKV